MARSHWLPLNWTHERWRKSKARNPLRAADLTKGEVNDELRTPVTYSSLFINTFSIRWSWNESNHIWVYWGNRHCNSLTPKETEPETPTQGHRSMGQVICIISLFLPGKFKAFSFSLVYLSFIMMILLVVSRSSWIWGLVSFNSSGKFLAIALSKGLFPLSPSLLLELIRPYPSILHIASLFCLFELHLNDFFESINLI